MSQFVRICPRCQTQNPEYEHLCTSCGQFIAMESPVPAVEQKKTESPKTEAQAETATTNNEQKAKNEPIKEKTASPSIYLELQSADKPVFTVKSGWVMGQSHPDNQAEIQISNDIAGSQFVHRNHCRFIYKDNNWYVQALDQKRYQGQFTNPTSVNDLPVNPDKARQIKNGDVLRLSGLYFQVKFIKTAAKMTATKSQPERELVAIMLTDMHGYSKHMERNEASAYSKLLEHNRIIRSMIESYRGREIKTIGDAFLIVFRSAIDAVDCALMIQRSFADYNLNQSELDRILVRIGIHLGDVLITENDVFGDGVNVAARIEPLAEPGGICLSEPVLETVRKKIQLDAQKIENSNLKNIEIAPTIYKINLTN